MKVIQEKLPDSQIGLEIEIPAETSKNTYEKIIQNLRRTANIPGFRKGKVPRQILLQRLGSNYVKAAALEELIQDSLTEAIKQESIESLGNHKLRSNFEELILQFTPGEPLTFSAAIDVPPTLQLGDYKTLLIKAEETPYDPNQIDKWLEERRNEQATLVPVEERPAQMGDVAIIDYQGRVADSQAEQIALEVLAGLQGTDFQVDLVEGRFIEGMVSGIVGMQSEETKEIAVQFPDDYPKEELAGISAVFEITLKELKAKELPELDDEFAEEVSDFDTLSELRESLEQRFTEEAANATKNSIQNVLIAELVKIAEVDLPDTLVQEEVTALLRQSAMQMEQMGLDIRELFTSDNISKLRENARPEAIARLKQSLVIKEIAQVEGIQAEPAAIEAKINDITQKYSQRDIDLEQLRKIVTEELVTEKTLDWLQEQATVELVTKGTLEKSEEESESQIEELEQTPLMAEASMPTEESRE